MAMSMSTLAYPGIITIVSNMQSTPLPPSERLVGQNDGMRKISRYLAQKML